MRTASVASLAVTVGGLMSKDSAEGKMVTVAVLSLALVLAAAEDAMRVVANVSLLLGEYHGVDCLQIFRSKPLSDVGDTYKIWRKLAAGKSTGVYSYQRYVERKRTKPWKVSCYKSIKILHDDEGSRRGYAELTKEFTIKDAIWIVFVKSLSTKFFEEADVKFDDNNVIAVMETSERVALYEAYRIGDGFPIRVAPIGNWTMEGGLSLNRESFYDRRTDLQGVVLRAGVTQNWPATYLKNGEWKGFLIKVWDEIQEIINCSSVYLKAEDDLVGMRMDNDSWNGLIGMALRNEVDVLVSEIVINKERSRVLKFMYPVMKTRFQIYMRHLGYEWQWTSVLKPFHVSVWTAAFFWIIVASVFLMFTYAVASAQGLETFDPEKTFTPVRSFFFVLQAFCQQGYHAVPDSYSCRIIFLVSYVVSGILIPSYSASLVSSLAQKTNFRSFDTLQDMATDGSYRLLVQKYTAQHAFFAHTKDNFLKEAYRKLAAPVPEEQKKMKLNKAIRTICQEPNTALFAIEEMVEVRLFRKEQPECTIVPLTTPVTSVSLTMATTRKSPFAGLINYHLQKLLLNGVVTRLKRAEFPAKGLPKKKDKEVGLKQLVSAFLFIILFVFASLFILFLEILHHWHVTRRNHAKRKNLRLYHHLKFVSDPETELYKKTMSQVY